MKITVRTFAILRELAADRLLLTVPDGARLTDAWAAFVDRFPAIEPHRPHVRAARNGVYAGWETSLADGDEVAFLPPVSGGGGTAALTDAVVDVAALAETVAGDAHGAVVTFTGRARNRSDDGREVTELEYEAYREMAVSTLAEIAGEAERRWDGCRVGVVHRTGIVPIGEVTVAIVVAAPHRGAAYEANRFVIEAIKDRLPIWKRERFVDGSEWKRPGA
jgi:MoaE-MoaD fusion protein